MTAKAVSADASHAPQGAEWQVLGLFSVVVVTVAFWTALASWGGTLVGSPLSGSTLMAIAGAIGLFLTLTLAPLMLRGSSR